MKDAQNQKATQQKSQERMKDNFLEVSNRIYGDLIENGKKISVDRQD